MSKQQRTQPVKSSPFDLYLNKRLFFITGKGGVGKTTVSMLCAKHCALNGKKTLIIECQDTPTIPSQCGNSSPLAPNVPIKLENNLYSTYLTADKSLESYLNNTLKVKRLVQVVLSTNILTSFFKFVPGLDQLMMLYSIYKFYQDERYDSIFVDAPATGHSMYLLNIPNVMLSLTKSGPLFNLSQQLYDLLQRNNISYNIVTLPEELPFEETVDLYNQMSEKLKVKIDSLLVNQFVYPIINQMENDHIHSALSKKQESSLSPYLSALSYIQNRNKTHESMYQQYKSKIDSSLMRIPMLINSTDIHNDLYDSLAWAR